ncbi:MAG: response regulator [Mariniphaga sp.]
MRLLVIIRNKKMEDDKAKNKNARTVLIAEDDEFNYTLIKTILSLHGFEVVRARDGKEAVDLYRSCEGVDIVLMDLQMPVMDGFTALKEIRSLDGHVPVIVQTTYNIDGMRDKAFRLGCNEFITKPIDPDFLMSTVEKYI